MASNEGGEVERKRNRGGGGGNGERRYRVVPAATLPSILWLNYSGRKIIQSPLLYKLSLEFYPDMLGREEMESFYLWTDSKSYSDKVESDFSRSKSETFFHPFGSLRSGNGTK